VNVTYSPTLDGFGEEVSVVMVAEEQYERLVGRARQPANIVDFFRKSPLMGLKLDLKRDRSPARDIDL